MVSSLSMFEWTLFAREGGQLCLHISAGVGSPLSTKAWRSIPSYARWVTWSSLRAGRMAVRRRLCIAVSNHTPP